MKELNTLPNGLFIYQDDKEFKFTLDAILLASFANINPKQKVIDLGTGTGSIAMLVACKSAFSVTGIDINDVTLSLFAESIVKNNLTDKVFAQKCDVKNIKDSFISGQFDIVVTNPPYRKLGHGRLRAGNDKTACHEQDGSTLDFIAAAKYLLKYGGKLNIVQLPERLDEILSYCISNKLQPKRLQFVHSNEQKKASLFLLEARYGSNQGLDVLPPLFVYDNQNNYTKQMMLHYNCFDKK